MWKITTENVWRAAAPERATIYSRYGKRVLLSAFAGLLKRISNPCPRKYDYLFELQVFSNEIIMITHTTAPV